MTCPHPAPPYIIWIELKWTRSIGSAPSMTRRLCLEKRLCPHPPAGAKAPAYKKETMEPAAFKAPAYKGLL